MKQSEIDREVRLLAKLAAKEMGWKSIGGTPYWTIGPLFFVLVQSAGAKEGSFYCSLRFKWLELDRALWKVLGMSSNENEPFSLHANGAFTITGQDIYNVTKCGLEWQPGTLAQQIKETTQRASCRATEVAAQITSIYAYLEFIQKEHELFIERHPKAVVNVWKEALLVAMLSGDLTTVRKIAQDRITAGDSGGFSSGGKSFFVRALELCDA